MPIQKDAKKFLLFEKSYWNYFLELEEQFLETRKYVAFDTVNYSTYSLEYLKLLEAVCSEIDVVGKEIAHQIDTRFKREDRNGNIQKWWFTIQQWYAENTLDPVKILNELEFDPWKSYEIEEFKDKQGHTRTRLKGKSQTPKWWTAYNKVKHNRTLDDPETDGKYFNRANLGNLCNAFSALYLLEKKYMRSVGRDQDYNRAKKSELFEREKPSLYWDNDGNLCQIDEE